MFAVKLGTLLAWFRGVFVALTRTIHEIATKPTNKTSSAKCFVDCFCWWICYRDSIAVTYAILTSAYFAFLLAIVGPKLMQQEGETSYVKAFLGVSVGFTHRT